MPDKWILDLCLWHQAEMAEHEAQLRVENAVVGLASPEVWMSVVAVQQWQQVDEHQQVLQHLAEHQYDMLDQLVEAQGQTCQQLWNHLM